MKIWQKLLIFIVAIPVLAHLALWAFAPTFVYLSLSGTGTQSGLDCSNTKPASYFNNASNWSTTPTGIQIGPDTLVHLTGVWAGGLSATALTFQGSGTPSHFITVMADTCNGTVDFTSAAWGNNGTFNTNQKSWLIIDGSGTGDAGGEPSSFVSVGIIENTANGTLSGNKLASKFFAVTGGSNIFVQNWRMINGFQRSGTADENPFDETTVSCMYAGASGVVNQLHFLNNQCDKSGWAIQVVGATDLFELAHSDISNSEHDWIAAATHTLVYNNHFRDWAIWDAVCPTPSTCPYHHDGGHGFAGSGGQIALLDYFNNDCNGSTDLGLANIGQFNQCMFLEGAGSPTTGMLPGGTVHMFNNIGLVQFGAPGDLLDTGNITTGNVNDIIANNMSFGPSTNDSSVAIKIQSSSGAIIANNASSKYGIFFASGNAGTTILSEVNFNFYQACTGFNCWFTDFVDTGAFGTWKAARCTGATNSCDQNGGANIASSSFFQINASCVTGNNAAICNPLPGSPLIGVGQNLSSLCFGQPRPGLGDLCFDRNGNARPSVGGWDVGAYQSSSIVTSPSPSICIKCAMLSAIDNIKRLVVHS